jgi:predicted SprT family Zn-dependent metalloprotease
LQRKAKTLGYFSPDRFVGRQDTTKVAEIALNPDTFQSRSDEDIVSTIAHEMAHAWQHNFGKPSRKSYHNAEWAAKMREIGLQPSSTGEPGGKETGQRMDHYIIPGGPFARSYANLVAKGFKLQWQSPAADKAPSKKSESKTKYTCSECDLNVWGKPEIEVACIACGVRMTIAGS